MDIFSYGRQSRGPYAAEAPDLILKPAEGYFIEDAFHERVFMARREVYKGSIKTDRSSYHRVHGIFLAAGSPFIPGRRVEPRVMDIAPTVLWLAELPIPDHMDGSLIKAALVPTTLEGRLPTYIHDEGGVSVVSAEESGAENIEERLRSLGYLR